MRDAGGCAYAVKFIRCWVFGVRRSMFAFVPGLRPSTVFVPSGVSYTLQVSTNLASTNWSALYTFQLTNSLMSITDFTATNAPRFYRLLEN